MSKSGTSSLFTESPSKIVIGSGRRVRAQEPQERKTEPPAA